MKKYEGITKYISQIEECTAGKWVIDKENDGTPEHPIHVPYVKYSKIIDAFIDDVYRFENENPDYQLNHYYDILKNNGIEWNRASMKEADVSVLDERCVMALIMGAVRTENFSDGALLAMLEDGSILKWLNRLKEIDEG